MKLVTARRAVAGADWLGGVPTAWDVKPLFTVLSETDQRNSSMEERNLLSLSYGKVIRKDIYALGGLLPESFETYQIVQAGDIVLRLTDLQNDQRSLRVGLVSERGIITSAYVNLRSRPQHDPRFLFYQLHNADIRKVFYNFGGGVRQSMKFADLRRLPILVPPHAEQKQIADFLDRETAKIDDLMERKYALVRELESQKAELVLLYVLQGTQHAQKRRYSGSPWLGEIPDHWKTSRLKYATSLIVDCPHETPVYSPDGEFPAIRTADVRLGTIDLRHAYRLAENEYLSRVRRARVLPYDIVYGREGERWGFAACVPESPTVCLGQRMMQFRSARHFDARFLMWHLNASCVYKQGAVDTVGATSPHVNVETIRNYQLVEPPLDEQRMIADRIDRETSKNDELVTVVDAGIERLHEYRLSLVSAAVTGQIDIRNYHPQEAAALCQ